MCWKLRRKGVRSSNCHLPLSTYRTIGQTKNASFIYIYFTWLPQNALAHTFSSPPLFAHRNKVYFHQAFFYWLLLCVKNETNMKKMEFWYWRASTICIGHGARDESVHTSHPTHDNGKPIKSVRTWLCIVLFLFGCCCCYRYFFKFVLFLLVPYYWQQ